MTCVSPVTRPVTVLVLSPPLGSALIVVSGVGVPKIGADWSNSKFSAAETVVFF